MRAAALLVLLVAGGALGAAGLARSSSNDCGNVADAGDDFAGATSIALPLARCYGIVPVVAGLPDLDWYSFAATSGDTLYVRIDTPDTSATNADICLYRPSEPTSFAFCRAFGGLPWSFALDETGDWRIRVVSNAFTLPAEYLLTMSVERQEESGTIGVGHPVLPLVRGLAAFDESYDGLDGVWIDLAVVADGRQTYEATNTASNQNLHTSFYDANGARMASQPCASHPRPWCVAPAGAARVLVETSQGLDVTFDATYRH